MMPLVRAAAMILSSALPLIAQAAITDIAFDQAGRFVHQATVAPKKFVEVCGKLDRGATVTWRFDAQAALDFNVHYHVGDKVEFPEKRDAVSVLKGELVAASDQHYCWMWRNTRDVGVSLNVELLRR